MGPFDLHVIHFFNLFAQRSWTFDSLVVQLSDNNFLSGGVLMALFWCAWVRSDDARREDREFLLFTLPASVFALFLARTLALTLPFRARPLLNPQLAFRIPYTMDPNTLIHWSSFPSDHAAIFFCLATGLWMVSRRLGSIALGWTLLVVCLPRIYLGIHYPTDILVGALLGIGVASLSKVVWLREDVTGPAFYWMDDYPASFNIVLFLCCFELAELFDSLRHIGLYGFDLVKTLVASL